MRLGKTALLEIVAIFQNAVFEGKDASQQLRELDLGPLHGWSNAEVAPDELELTQQYVNEHPRAQKWEEEDLN